MTIVKELNELAYKMTGTNPKAKTDQQALNYIEQNYSGGSGPLPSNVITTDNIGNYAITTENADNKGIVTKDAIKYNEILPLKFVDNVLLDNTAFIITDEFTIENLNNIANDINWYVLNGIEPGYAFYEKPLIFTFLYSQTENGDTGYIEKVYKTLYSTEFETAVYHEEENGTWTEFGKLIFRSVDGFSVSFTRGYDETSYNMVWYVRKITTN